MTKQRSYSVSRILSQVQKITGSEALIGYLGTKPTSEDFGQFVDDIAKLLPKGIPHGAVRSSLLYSVGDEVTPAFIESVAWLLSGNIHRLKEDKPVFPWSCQQTKEWMPCQVTRFATGKDKFGNVGGFVTARILAGSAAGLSSTTFWSRKLASYLSGKIFGFSRYNGPRPYVSPMSFVGMRFSAMFIDDHNADQPKFKAMRSAPGLLTWNKQLIDMRKRVIGAKFQCPFAYKHLCHKCPRGQESCPVACHKFDYAKRECSGCGEVTWFDPESKSGVCLRCTSGGIRVQSQRTRSSDEGRVRADNIPAPVPT